MRALFASTFFSTAFLLGAPAMALTVDFTHGLPAGTTVSGNTMTVGAYQFTGDAAAPVLGNIYLIPNVIYSTALVAPAPLHSLTVARTDHKLFDLLGIGTFVGGIVQTGVTDFEVIPFDATGTEGTPVIFTVNAGLDNLSWTAIGQSTLANITSFRIDAVPLLTAFTNFTLVSPADPVPEPTTTMMLGLGLALLVMRGRLRL
jgi:PEP-CTERM motif